jgi:hypothetical protein
MFRKAFWIVAGLFPLFVVAFALLIGPNIIDKIIASPPERFNAFSDWWLAYWWLVLGVILSLHLIFFALHPFFNRHLTAWFSKVGWALVNFFAWPFGTALYVFLSSRSVVDKTRAILKD